MPSERPQEGWADHLRSLLLQRRDTTLSDTSFLFVSWMKHMLKPLSRTRRLNRLCLAPLSIPLKLDLPASFRTARSHLLAFDIPVSYVHLLYFLDVVSISFLSFHTNIQVKFQIFSAFETHFIVQRELSFETSIFESNESISISIESPTGTNTTRYLRQKKNGLRWTVDGWKRWKRSKINHQGKRGMGGRRRTNRGRVTTKPGIVTSFLDGKVEIGGMVIGSVWVEGISLGSMTAVERVNWAEWSWAGW